MVILTKIQSILLFVMTGFIIVLLLASGHKVDFRDYSQLKLILELIVFGVTAIMLLSNVKDPLKFSSLFLISLLGLVQLSFVDILIEIWSVDYGEEVPILQLSLFMLIFINNAFLIYSQIKVRLSMS